jgi:holo-[acyl-carrier protein] synthase
MDIVGIGTEIVECLRIRRMIERHGERFLTQVYTPREIRYCHARKHSTEHFASRWAAKQAVLKCLQVPFRADMVWTELEVRTGNAAAPRVLLGGLIRERAQALRVSAIELSLAYCRAYATAYTLAVRPSVPTAT